MNNKRPRNNRNNSRRGGGGQGGGRQSHTLESNGPGMKIRGNPNQIFEKYQALARDAHTAGDRVMEENYAQHAEHYYRLANGDGANNQQRQQQQQNQQQQQPQQQTQPDAVVSLTETPSVESEGAEGAIVEPVGVEAGNAEKEATDEPSTKDMAKEPQPVVE